MARSGKPKNIGAVGKQIAFLLVERGGHVRFYHVAIVTGATQRSRLSRILSRKDEAQNGARSIKRTEADRLIADLDQFAAWAEALLSGR